MEKINGANYVPGKLYRLIDQADHEPTNFSDGGQENHWRWVCIGVIGNGSTSSVIGVFQITGTGHARTVKLHTVEEYESCVTPARFAETIYEVITSGHYPDCQIAIDGDGLGAETAIILSETYGLIVQQIHWGRRPPQPMTRARYLNQRAYAHFASKKALEEGRLQLRPDQKVIEQASHISCGMNNDGELFVTPKMKMLMPVGHWDICCFAQLVDIND